MLSKPLPQHWWRSRCSCDRWSAHWSRRGQPHRARDEPEDLEETPKGIALAALREIEFDRATGKLSDEDYARSRPSTRRRPWRCSGPTRPPGRDRQAGPPRRVASP